MRLLQYFNFVILFSNMPNKWSKTILAVQTSFTLKIK